MAQQRSVNGVSMPTTDLELASSRSSRCNVRSAFDARRDPFVEESQTERSKRDSQPLQHFDSTIVLENVSEELNEPTDHSEGRADAPDEDSSFAVYELPSHLLSNSPTCEGLRFSGMRANEATKQ
jgi:hypothetical protein